MRSEGPQTVSFSLINSSVGLVEARGALVPADVAYGELSPRLAAAPRQRAGRLITQPCGPENGRSTSWAIWKPSRS